MELQRLIDQGVDEQEALRVAAHNPTPRDLLPAYGWTDAWFTRVFLLSLPVRESRQEAAALQNFVRWERRHGGQPQNT
jgi:hypothetical protein